MHRTNTEWDSNHGEEQISRSCPRMSTVHTTRDGRMHAIAMLHCPCSLQMRPVTRSLSSCLPPPEKKSAMFLWMMSPSKLSRTFRWLSLMLRGVPCHVSFRPPPPTSRLYPNPCASLSSPMNRRNAMYTGAIPSRNASKCRQKCCPKHLKTCMYQTQGG